MAWRIDTQLIRGEIDNRTRGRITGRFWFVGREHPVLINLQGNAARDLAGRQLAFINPGPKDTLDPNFAPEQIGVAGEFTASRKRKVPDIPLDQIGTYYEQKKPFPWHWGNCVYFEWFSAANGRVVIEAADYQLTLSPEAAWEMTLEEEAEQQRANAKAVEAFFEQLGFLTGGEKKEDEVFAPQGGEDSEDEENWTDSDGEDEEAWKTDEPLSEEEADELMADSDRLTDRLMARLNEAGENADLEAILEEELERRRSEGEKQPLTPEEEDERAAWIEEINAAAAEIAQDHSFHEELDRCHPLAERARELTLRLMALNDAEKWTPKDASSEHPVADLVSSMMKAGGKLAGALDGRNWPPELEDCALCISWLKRARSYLDDALVAADFCGDQHLVPQSVLADIVAEAQVIQRETCALIEDLRERLSRGFE